MKNHKVVVLGPIPRDTITTHNNEVIQKYGCATHTSIALSNLMTDDDEIIPITHVRKRDVAAIKELLSTYKNINCDYINSHMDQGDVINLKFLDQNKRVEKQTASALFNSTASADLSKALKRVMVFMKK